MPTPMPIIATIAVVKSGMAMGLLSSVTMAVAQPSPNSAVPIGRPIASTEPKAMIRMTTAARIPYSSLSGSSNSENRSPPYSIWTPGIGGSSSPASRMSLPSATSSSNGRSATSSWAKAIVPSAEIWLGWSYGLVTVMPSASSASAISSSNRSCTSGRRCPARP